MSMLGLGLSVCNQSFDRLGALDSSEKCKEYDGVDQYSAKAAHDSVFNHASGGNSKFSISFWIKTDTNTVDCLVARNTYGGGGGGIKNDWAMTLIGFSNVLAIDTFESGTNYQSISNIADTVTLTDGNWHHIAMTYDGEESEAKDRLSVYLNGVESSSATHNVGCPVEIDGEEPGFVLGNYYADSVHLPYDGRMDECFYVNRYVFSLAQVTDLYRDGLTHDLSNYLPAENRAYYIMGDSPDTAGYVKDSIGTNHLSNINMDSNDTIVDAP